MARAKSRPRPEATMPSPFDQARDELFQHIMRCEVIGALPEHQAEWFDDTMPYLAERYPELGEAKLKELRALGERFAKPLKAAQPAESVA